MPCPYVNNSRCIDNVGDETIEETTSKTKCVAIVRGLPRVQILLFLVSFSLLGFQIRMCGLLSF